MNELSTKKVSYGFLDIERGAGPKIGHGYGDKVGGRLCQPSCEYIVFQELDTEPSKYNVVDYSGGLLETDSK